MDFQDPWLPNSTGEAVRTLSSSRPINSLLNELVRRLADDLGARGLKRAGLAFLADFGETFGVAEIQKDKYNDASHLRFTFNCGGGSQFLFNAVPLGFPEFKKRYGICPFMLRAGWSTGQDLWWTIKLTDGDVDSVRESIVRVFDNEIIPYLRTFESDETIRRRISDPEFPGLPDPIRQRYLEAYKNAPRST